MLVQVQCLKEFVGVAGIPGWQSESAETTGVTEPVFFVAVSQLGFGNMGVL